MIFKDYVKKVLAKKLNISSRSITDQSRLYKDLNAPPEEISNVVLAIWESLKDVPLGGFGFNEDTTVKQGLTFGDLY